MQRFLRLFTFLSLLAFSYQLSAQGATLEVAIFDDQNGDGNDEGVGIGGLEGDLVLYEDLDGNGTGDPSEDLGLTATDIGGVYQFSNITVNGNNFITK